MGGVERSTVISGFKKARRLLKYPAASPLQIPAKSARKVPTIARLSDRARLFAAKFFKISHA